ncbi:hypothetical protein [Erwinia mallotivora]|uniref:hypothetical protein n=1 Tax=Erwinia mallotivora TaxID=69222 RepID=UPI0021C10135|nr:hypothetical protein [Erwinia mallotivora]
MSLLECFGVSHARLSGERKSEAVVAKKDKNLSRLGESRFLRTIRKSYNAVVHMNRRGTYKPGEMYISSPISSSVTATVFNTVPDELKFYCENQIIKLDQKHLIKNRITRVTTSDCSNTGMALPENPQGDLELMEVTSGKKEYRIKDWDMTPVHAWD